MEKNHLFGTICSESLTTYDQESCAWKTHRTLFDSVLIPYAGKWPASGMISNGELYQLNQWEHHTTEEGGMLLPTPTASEHKYRLKGKTQASRCLEALARTGRLTGERGRLNPAYVEEMMGFPVGWTE